MDWGHFFKNKIQAAKIFVLRQSWLTSILGWYGLYEFITQGPHKARRIALLYLLTHRNRKLRHRLVNELSSQPECQKVIVSRKRITTPLEELSVYPDGTLGKQFYLHMKNNNIKLVVPLDAPIKK